MPIPIMPDELFNQLTTGVLVIENSTLTFANEAARNLLQLQPTQINKNFSETIDHIQIEKALIHAQNQIQGSTLRKTKLKRHDGSQFSADCVITPLFLGQENCIGCILEITDVDRKLQIEKEDAQLHQQETIRMLTKGLAHEVKNPLSGIRGAAQLLEKILNQSQRKDLNDYTQLITREVDRLGLLVDRMLGPNKIHQKAPTNIHQILENVCQISQHSLNDCAEILWQKNYDVSIPEFLSDADGLTQLFLNLIQNAIQSLQNAQGHTQEKPKIHIKTRIAFRQVIGSIRHPMALKIDICDNGPGVPDALKDTLFFPLVSGRAQGSGLGLSISQSIVQQHKGILEYHEVDGMTQFRVLLPFEVYKDNES
jgi:two-component system nitrogen regulation sensor histidine kinase GlnL